MQDVNEPRPVEPPETADRAGDSADGATPSNLDGILGTSNTAPAGAAAKGNTTLVVLAAIVGNILVGIVKFIAAILSGSQAMISEGIHSIVDSGNGLLVLFGIHQSRKGADEDHPFGYGKELYFWTLVVAVLIFAVGGGISFVEGVSYLSRITPDTHLGDPLLSYIVIGLAVCIEGTSLTIAIKEFNEARGGMRPFEFIKYCKDPSLYTVVLEDMAAETGLLLAFLGVLLGHIFGNPYFDGIASVLISFLLMVVAIVLLTQTKKLLVGEGLNKPETRDVIELVEANPWVVDCGRVLTMYMGPHQLLITIDANFSLDAAAADILKAVDDIEASIKKEFPDATRVFIEVESLRQVRAQAQAFEEMESDVEEEWEEREAEEAAKAAEQVDEDESVLAEAISEDEATAERLEDEEQEQN